VLALTPDMGKLAAFNSTGARCRICRRAGARGSPETRDDTLT